MTIYTGYFAQIKKYQAADLTPVSIARYSPAWFSGYCLKDLAPSDTLLKRYKAGQVSQEEYKKQYLQQLETIRWGEILQRIREIAPQVVLCCYEKPTDFCHRHILAEYLNEAGYSCFEVMPKTCNQDCQECKHLNGKTDDKGYPWGYECLKYRDSVFREHFGDTKTFLTTVKGV